MSRRISVLLEFCTCHTGCLEWLHWPVSSGCGRTGLGDKVLEKHFRLRMVRSTVIVISSVLCLTLSQSSPSGAWVGLSWPYFCRAIGILNTYMYVSFGPADIATTRLWHGAHRNDGDMCRTLPRTVYQSWWSYAVISTTTTSCFWKHWRYDVRDCCLGDAGPQLAMGCIAMLPDWGGHSALLLTARLAIKQSLTILWRKSGKISHGWVWTANRVDCKWSHWKVWVALCWEVSIISWQAESSLLRCPFKPVVLVSCVLGVRCLSVTWLRHISLDLDATKWWRTAHLFHVEAGWHHGVVLSGRQSGTSGDTSGHRQGNRLY